MDIKEISLSDMLSNIEHNQYKIPDFQRDFIWKPDNIILLLDSIFKNYPVGAFLTLSSSNINLAFNKLDTHSPLKDDYRKDSFYVLDGQQRITSIARAFFKGDDKYNFYLNIETFCLFCISEKQKTYPQKYINYNYSGEAIFEARKNKNIDASITESKLIRVDLLKDRSYENPKIFDLDNFLQKIFLPKYKIDNDFLHEIKILIQEKISSTFHGYKLIIQQLDKNETIDAICRIFETINNTGVKLTIFDLLVAKTYGKDFNLRQVSDNFSSTLKEIGLNQDNLLHITLMLKQISKGTLPNISRENLFNLNSNDFILDKVNAIKKSMENLKKWQINSRVYSKATLDALNVLLISIESHRILKGEESIFIKYKNLIEKLVFSRSYSNKFYNKATIPSDYKILNEIFKLEAHDINYKHYQEQLFEDYLMNKISPQDILATSNKQKIYSIILSILYKDIYSNLEGNQYDNISDLEEHHIIPKKTCLQYGLDRISTNSVANILLIDGVLNRHISDSNPDIYLTSLLEKHNDLNIFNNHKLLVISSNLKVNFQDYKKFIEKRAVFLADMFNEYIERNQLTA